MTKTCETCKFFKPVMDHRLFEGTCHNMRATLGAVIQTSRSSTCNYHEPATEAAHDLGQTSKVHHD